MAKRRKSGSREIHYISNPRLLTPRILTPRPPRLTFLQTIEDRRTFHPGGLTRPARMINQAAHRLQVARPFKSPYLKNTIPTAVGFRVPKKVAICIRRKQRKEVLFAKGKTGSGSSRNKRSRRSHYSDIHC